MKLVVFLFCLSAASAAVFALDLPSLARRERARRGVLAGNPARVFDDSDLERYRRERSSETAPPPPPTAPPPAAAPRDLARDKAHWRKETEQYEREVARIEASARRLEWRLNEKRARRRSRDWLAEDPAIGVLEDSIRALREERQRLEERFRERARKEGALPGWIR